MKKAIILFDEKTILNFPFLFSLSKRYKWLTYSLPLAIILTAAFLYKTQHTIYGHDVSLSTNNKGVGSSQGGPSNPMMVLFGDGQQFLMKNDLVAIFKSYNFIDLLAHKVLAHEHFERFNFNSIYAKKMQKWEKFFPRPHDQAAVIEALHGLLPGFFAFDSGMAEYRYVLKVNTLDSYTTGEITQLIIEAMEEYRLSHLKGDIGHQINSFEDLLEKGREDLKNKGGENILEEKENIETQMIDAKDRLRAAQASLQNEKRALDALEIQVKQGRDLLNQENDWEKNGKYESYSILRDRLKEVRSHIKNFKAVPMEARSAGDKIILKELQNELISLQEQMKKQGKVDRHLAGHEVVELNQEKNNATLAFDYKVAQKKHIRLKEEVSKLENRIKNLIDKKVKVDQLMIKVGPDLDYIKTLEAKIVSLRLMNSTIISDIMFEKYSKGPAGFTKASFAQIAIFAAFINIFLFMVLCIAVFLFDDRIHDEEELETYFREFQLIGRTPNFE